MKQFVLGVLVALALLGGSLWAVRVWHWRQYVNDSSWAARNSVGYLNAPVVKLPDGRVLTRAQVLDVLIAQAVKAKE